MLNPNSAHHFIFVYWLSLFFLRSPWYFTQLNEDPTSYTYFNISIITTPSLATAENKGKWTHHHCGCCILMLKSYSEFKNDAWLLLQFASNVYAHFKQTWCRGVFNLNEKQCSSASCMVLTYLSQVHSCKLSCFSVISSYTAWSIFCFTVYQLLHLSSGLLIFLSVTLSHVDLVHGSGAHSSLTSKTISALCVHAVFAS